MWFILVTVSNSGYIVSNENNELERIWKGTFVYILRFYPGICLGTEEKL